MNVFELVGKIGLEGAEKVKTQLGGIEGFVKKNEKAFKAAGMAMTGMGAAIVGGLGLAMKSAADFETAMREVNTMMGLSHDEFTDFSKEVQTLAADLGVDAVGAAKALYQAISAGVPKENAIEFLTIATKAAIGGVTDTETAVDGLSTVINAFKLPLSDTQKVADLMFTTVKGGKTTFDELSASLFNVAPIAAASGVSFEEVSAALATMTKQGVPTKIATTQLRQAMVALQKPTEDMNKSISDLGYTSGQTMLDELGLADTLNILRDSTGGNNEALMKMFGSVEAGSAILALTGDNAQMFAGDLDAMAGAGGAAQAAFEEMEVSTSRQMAKLKASFSDVAITVGNVLLPALTGIVDKIKPIIESIRNWMDANPGLVKAIIITTGAIGGLMLVLGPLLIALPGIVAIAPAVGAAFTTMAGPAGLLAAALALIVVGAIRAIEAITKVEKKVLQDTIERGDEYIQKLKEIEGAYREGRITQTQYFLGVKALRDVYPKLTDVVTEQTKIVQTAQEEWSYMNEIYGDSMFANRKLLETIEVANAKIREQVKIVQDAQTEWSYMNEIYGDTSYANRVLLETFKVANAKIQEQDRAAEVLAKHIEDLERKTWHIKNTQQDYNKEVADYIELAVQHAAGIVEVSTAQDGLNTRLKEMPSYLDYIYDAAGNVLGLLKDWGAAAQHTLTEIPGLAGMFKYVKSSFSTSAGVAGGVSGVAVATPQLPPNIVPDGRGGYSAIIGGIAYPVAPGDIPNIFAGYTPPEFQHGGIVPGSIGQSILATVHGGETITPAGKGGLVTITGNTFNVRQESDIDRIAELLVSKIRLRTGAKI